MTTTPINYYHMNDPHLDQRNATQHLPLKTHGKILDKILVDESKMFYSCRCDHHDLFRAICVPEHISL